MSPRQQNPVCCCRVFPVGNRASPREDSDWTAAARAAFSTRVLEDHEFEEWGAAYPIPFAARRKLSVQSWKSRYQNLLRAALPHIWSSTRL